MHIVRGKNVQETLVNGSQLLFRIGEETQSRNGPVLVAPCPVTTITERPQERVLLDAKRDANPFFHLFECLWMISAQNDATWLDQFVSDFSSRFAEQDGIMHGAYGFRWRKHFGYDQLFEAIRLLKLDHLDRQVVLAMWDPFVDQAKGKRDRPCNTHMYPRMRLVNDEWVLDLTVCCRSNDVVWGCYGANAVHFSFVQEFMAGQIGCKVGTLYQVSNNWHGYLNTLDKVRGIKIDNQYEDGRVAATPIGDDWDGWTTDLAIFMFEPDQNSNHYTNEWFRTTVSPMYSAHLLWKSGHRKAAMEDAKSIASTDWRKAVVEWMERRA